MRIITGEGFFMEKPDQRKINTEVFMGHKMKFSAGLLLRLYLGVK